MVSKRGGYREGAGRPEVREEEKRKIRTFTASDEEWKELKLRAKNNNLSISEFIRMKTLS